MSLYLPRAGGLLWPRSPLWYELSPSYPPQTPALVFYEWDVLGRMIMMIPLMSKLISLRSKLKMLWKWKQCPGYYTRELGRSKLTISLWGRLVQDQLMKQIYNLIFSITNFIFCEKDWTTHLPIQNTLTIRLLILTNIFRLPILKIYINYMHIKLASWVTTCPTYFSKRVSWF